MIDLRIDELELILRALKGSKASKDESKKYLFESISEKIANEMKALKVEEEISAARFHYEISFDYKTQDLVILNRREDVETRISNSVIQEEKIPSLYTIVDREDEKENIEKFIAEAESEADKYLMREDLNYLNKSRSEYVFGYYGTSGFIAEDLETLSFNKICEDMINEYNKIKG